MKVLLNYPPSPEHLERLRAVAPGVRFAIAAGEDDARREIVDAEAVLGNRHFLQTLPSATRLRWMQSNSMGVDTILRGGGTLLDGVVLTCARGVYADEVADHALALLLGIARGLREAVEAYHARQWGRWSLLTLSGRRALVLGWGAIGRAVGRRLLAFGASVEGVRRGGRSGSPGAEADGVVLHGPGTWRATLSRTDLLVIALPLTAETAGCVGAAELASLPGDAIVVNVGRGGVIDQSALFAALRAGKLRGAGLDTLVDEPPASDAPAWDVPRLLLSPHVGRSLETGSPRWEPLFEENLRRFVGGEPLLNVVDQSAGY